MNTYSADTLFNHDLIRHYNAIFAGREIAKDEKVLGRIRSVDESGAWFENDGGRINIEGLSLYHPIEIKKRTINSAIFNLLRTGFNYIIGKH